MSERFLIGVYANFDLTVEEIWPDGDAPENPTANDVAEKIESLGYYGPEAFLREWGMSHDLHVDVEGREINF